MPELNTLLGLRTDFSLGESVIASEKVIEIAKRMNQKHVVVADTMTFSAMIDVAKKAAKEGIEAHIGVRLRLVDDPTDRSKDQNKTAYYLKAFPKNEAGLRELFALVSRGHDEDRFYVFSRLGLDDVIEMLSPENVVITTGDSHGLFTRPGFSDRWDRLRAWSEDTVIELVPVPSPYFERSNLNAISLIDRAAPVVVTYPTLFDEGCYDAFFMNMAIQNRSNLRRAFTVHEPHFKDFAPKTAAELVGLVKLTIDGIKLAGGPAILGDIFKQALTEGNEWFLRETAYRWQKADIALPRLDAEPDRAVLEACKKGIATRLGVEVFGYKPTPEDIRDVYVPRLKYELGVLRDLKFADYFLVVADLVNWAKANEIMVGPGRGSVGGSLVAFLMGITDIDPIRFGLLFERFINPSRNDLPDADLDFMSTRRHEIIAYLESKYGVDRVAGINNYGVLQSASAIKDVARVHGMNVNEITCTKLVPKPFGQPVDLETARKEVGEIQRFADTYPRVWKDALGVQDVMRSYGRHAAGTIVSGVPLVERAIVERDGENRKVNWDMRVCEEQGLVKLDVLGLSTLDTLARAVRYIKERHGKTIDLMTIPLDDADTLKAFSMGETIGVFQFEGGAARRILREMAGMSDLTFNDLTAANALNRPGPIEAGLVQDYVDARNGMKTIGLPHPNMAPALEETFNVIVYQEQVMRVAVDLCGFTLSEADKLRKAMGKKDRDLMATFRDKFVKGAESHSGMNETVAGELFDQIEVFAGYAFNKSHAAEYSLISYQCMWLKVHYPVEFYAASLSTVEEKKLQVVVNDALKSGITVLPPDVNISTNEFEILNDTTLCIPFNRVKGISDKAGDAIARARALTSYEIEEKVSVPGKRAKETVMRSVPCKAGSFASLDEFQARVERRLVNVRTVDSLKRVGAFARVEPGELPALHTDRKRDQMVLLPGLMTGVLVADRDIPKDKYTVAHLLEMQREIEAVDKEVFHSRPAMGTKAKFMAVMDCPGRSEEFDRAFASGESFGFTDAALKMAGLGKKDGYWTGLSKKRKSGKTVTTGEIKTYSPFLNREIELLKPPLIVTLGSNAARHFIPDLKGDMMDHVGRTFYNEKMDAMILIGFNPQMIYHDPDKLELLAELFGVVRSIVDPEE